jgi:hypothetical protein
MTDPKGDAAFRHLEELVPPGSPKAVADLNLMLSVPAKAP